MPALHCQLLARCFIASCAQLPRSHPSILYLKIYLYILRDHLTEQTLNHAISSLSALGQVLYSILRTACEVRKRLCPPHQKPSIARPRFTEKPFCHRGGTLSPDLSWCNGRLRKMASFPFTFCMCHQPIRIGIAQP